MSGNVHIVFIHGIFSRANTFNQFFEILKALDDGLAARASDYEYKYNVGIAENGQEFALWLKARFGDDRTARVAIVAHSMGGLVSRAALLQEHLPFVTHLFMLGTPNFGALRPSQLSLAMLLAHRGANMVAGLFPRQRGVIDLSNIYGVFEPLIAAGDNLTYHVNYITIPGCYYHDNRVLAHHPTSIHEAAFSFLMECLNWVGIKLEKPHDGIVEERSNEMSKRGEAGYESEKDLNNKIEGKRYVHVRARVCRDLVHTAIHGNAEIVKVVVEIIGSASLEAWCASVRTRSDINGLPPEMFSATRR